MPDPRPPAEDALEPDLRALGRAMAWPPTPELAARFEARAAFTAPAEPRRARTRWLSLAAVLVLALVVSALLAPATVRQAVADRLGLRGISIFHVTSVPQAVM